MKRTLSIGLLFAAALSAFAQPPGGGHGGTAVFPPNPEIEARAAKVSGLRDQAETVFKAGDTDRTIDLLRQAVDIERPYGPSNVAYDLARVLTVAGRTKDALEAYKLVFRWNEKQGDLVSPSVGDMGVVMNYAILLAQMGKEEEAKAIYYLGLRMFNPYAERNAEPVPFLTVFDQDPDGIYMEYTPKRLEAAALMAIVLRHGNPGLPYVNGPFLTPEQQVAQVKQLAPDWFYPHMWEASRAYYDSKRYNPRLAAAKARANDQERQLIDKFEIELVELIQINLAADTPDAGDRRPMTEGTRRRALMKVLKPNPTILKRLAAG